MTKEFNTTDELIDLLELKGVVIFDRIKTKYLIERYSYYSIINTYKWIFKNNGVYKENASFNEIYAMYRFDKSLKIIMLKYILEIEAIIKTKISELLASKYSLNNYFDINVFDLGDNNSNLVHIENLINDLNNEITKNIGKHDAVTHYMNKYGFVPPWVVTKILSLGTISKLYGLMKQKDKQDISKQFNLDDKILKSILCNLTFVRNISAHDDRLYTYRSNYYIKIDKSKKLLNKSINTNLFVVIKSIELLLEQSQVTEMKNAIISELNILKNNLTSISIDEVLKVMGFDLDYYYK